MGWATDKPPVDPEDTDPNKRTSLSFSSRFTIGLQPEPAFKGHLPIVGVVVEGMDVLRAVSRTPADKKHRPKTPWGLEIEVVITDCGQLGDDACRTPQEAEADKPPPAGEQPLEARVEELDVSDGAGAAVAAPAPS